MSLTAFQHYRRMKQVEEMKPENIEKAAEVKEEVVAPVEEAPTEKEVKEEVVEAVEEKPSTRRRRSVTEE